MKNLNNFKIVNFCEIDKNAARSYCAIHGVDNSLNLGDITKVDINNLPKITCLVGGSPCTDFSPAGYQKGTECVCNACGHAYNPLTVPKHQRSCCPECGSDNIARTRSSLLTYYLDILDKTQPEFTLYENVGNITSKKFENTFPLFISEVENCGYNVYYSKVNAKYFYPQNRERLIVVGIRKDLDNGKFSFPQAPNQIKSINDLLDNKAELFDGTDENVLVDTTISPSIRKNILEHKDRIICSDKPIYHIPVTSGFQDNQVGIKYSPALRACNGSTIVLNTYDTDIGKKFYIKRLTPKEAFRFMGFEDDDYEKATNAGVKKTNIYKQAGNSIVVEVIYAVLKSLYDAMPYLFNDIKLIHLFSGIGAFEKAFYRVLSETKAKDINIKNVQNSQLDYLKTA